MTETEKTKKFCPNCGSTEVIYGVLGTTASFYECKRCGFRSPIIVEDGKLAEKLGERYEKKRKPL